MYIHVHFNLCQFLVSRYIVWAEIKSYFYEDESVLITVSHAVNCFDTNAANYQGFFLPMDCLKSGYIEFAMAGNYSTRSIQLLLTRRVNHS